MSNSIAGVQEASKSDIAIIGMRCRVPGADSTEQFWTNLKNGIESVAFFEDRELREAGVPESLLNNPGYVKARAEIHGIDLFDAAFFGFTPREAEALDPQIRLFLEASWEVLETAGYAPQVFEGLIGVYAGAGTNSYAANVLSDPRLVGSLGPFAIRLANDSGALATATSYKLNLRGPSLTIQTACSTSLVAVHMACQGLLDGECDMALAGGVSISISDAKGYLYESGGILSSDGHCRAFDAKADGTIGGDGLCLVLLKRMEEALADGDCVHAVIKGSAVNNDGSLKAGYTAPGVDGQVRVIRAAQAVAGVDPESVSYIETHGTGTPLGDPLEIAALQQAFRANTQKKGFCAIGSVKTNVGHLNTAAGTAGLIKTVLSLEHKQLPPSLHFERPNTKIDFENSPFFVNTKLSEWLGPRPLRAGVSSFGIGGTNVHVISEEAPAIPSSSSCRSTQLLVLSARTENALDAASRNLAGHLQQHPNSCLADVAYTLQVGRKAFAHRRAIVCKENADAIRALEGLDPERVKSGMAPESGCGVVFLFPGQGTQFVHMGRELFETEASFRKLVDESCEYLTPVMNFDLRRVLYPSFDDVQWAQKQLKKTAIAQPALFVIEYAMARLWMGWGITPQAMIGHSLGEYTAACLAGVMSEHEALDLVAARGRLMQQMQPGNMLAIELPENAVRSRLEPGLSLAAINGPTQCVISGEAVAIEQIERKLEAEEIACHRLETSHAFHSQMMKPILERFRLEVNKVKLRAPKLPYLSNVTGNWISEQETTDPSYWVRHLIEPVHFARGIQAILKQEGRRAFLEVGPGQTLNGLVRRSLTRENHLVVSSMSAARQQNEERSFILGALGELWLAGVAAVWQRLHSGERRYRQPLPTYPFERQRYWYDSSPARSQVKAAQPSFDKKTDVADWFYVPSWKQSVLLEQDSGRKGPAEWLVFVDEGGLGQELAQQLLNANQNVVTVHAGDRFLQVNEGVYRIHPRSPEDFETLLTELCSRGKTPQRILHLWSMTHESSGDDHSRLPPDQHAGFYSLVFLAKALGNTVKTTAVEIAVITHGVHLVTGEERLHPENAIVLGPCTVIPQEYSNIVCRNIDLGLCQTGTWHRERLLDNLMMELMAESSDPIVAYRSHQRWVRTFEPLKLKAKDKKPVRLRSKGVYLITGGLGRIGLEIAHYLAHSVQARLVLTTRSLFPAKEEWAQWLTSHESNDEICGKIRKLQALSELGAEILVVRADVSDLDQMRQAIREVHQSFGRIKGVIHGAGNTGGAAFQAIQELEVSGCEAHFRPKVQGLAVLEAVLQEESLDWCVLLSSLSSVLGGFGYCAYAAANLFMDAFVQARQSERSFVWRSVNWDGWKFKGRTAAATRLGNSLPSLSMSPQEGVDAFHRLLHMNQVVPRIVVSTGNLGARLGRWVQRRSSTQAPDGSKLGLVEIKEDRRASTRPKRASEYVVPRSDLERAIAEIWEGVLGEANLGVNDSFFELGGHSLLAMRIAARIRTLLEVEYTAATLYEAPTIAGAAESIVRILIASAGEHADELVRRIDVHAEDGKEQPKQGDICTR